MGKSLAVLDWKDIQVLVEMCSRSFPSGDPRFSRLEEARRQLVDCVLAYLQEWLPGREIDDEARKVLVLSLEAFSRQLTETDTSKLPGIRDRSSMSPAEMVGECLRIRKLLRGAMGLADDSPPSGGPALGGACLVLWSEYGRELWGALGAISA